MSKRTIEEIREAVQKAKAEGGDGFFPITLDELANVFEALNAEVIE